MKSFLTYLSSSMALACLLPLTGQAAMPFVQLNQSVLIHIPAKDVPDFKRFIGQALNDTSTNQPRTWHSSTQGNRPPVAVELTPSSPVVTQAAGACRLLSANVSQRNISESWRVWFCQQPNGSWKISGLE